MHTKVVKDILDVIRTEQERRHLLLADEDPESSGEQWVTSDVPFINELCLMLLTVLRHQIERSLIGFAARANDDGKEISSQQYQENASKMRKKLRTKDGWNKVSCSLKLKSCEGNELIEILRHLVNSYKHHPFAEPDEMLLKGLNLEHSVSYAALPESGAVKKGLELSMGLEQHADYLAIADRFVDIAEKFLADVQRQTRLSRVKPGKISFRPQDFAR